MDTAPSSALFTKGNNSLNVLANRESQSGPACNKSRFLADRHKRREKINNEEEMWSREQKGHKRQTTLMITIRYRPQELKGSKGTRSSHKLWPIGSRVHDVTLPNMVKLKVLLLIVTGWHELYPLLHSLFQLSLFRVQKASFVPHSVNHGCKFTPDMKCLDGGLANTAFKLNLSGKLSMISGEN
ncbi:hypothetical protein BaRGS_00030961 [Batillaria attramentaria]|uniref:Uncharacterized protein n=1 Tax=Batillaria attramentaria TaxID=370345 RepID=A0ABD0JT79_9CAEN